MESCSWRLSFFRRHLLISTLNTVCYTIQQLGTLVQYINSSFGNVNAVFCNNRSRYIYLRTIVLNILEHNLLWNMVSQCSILTTHRVNLPLKIAGVLKTAESHDVTFYYSISSFINFFSSCLSASFFFLHPSKDQSTKKIYRKFSTSDSLCGFILPQSC